MIYNNESHIKSVEDVKTFFHHLVDQRKVNFHPDDDFAQNLKDPQISELRKLKQFVYARA